MGIAASLSDGRYGSERPKLLLIGPLGSVKIVRITSDQLEVTLVTCVSHRDMPGEPRLRSGFLCWCMRVGQGLRLWRQAYLLSETFLINIFLVSNTVTALNQYYI